MARAELRIGETSRNCDAVIAAVVVAAAIVLINRRAYRRIDELENV
jgi:hypothetical protein